jgi:hypothetical protein
MLIKPLDDGNREVPFGQLSGLLVLFRRSYCRGWTEPRSVSGALVEGFEVEVLNGWFGVRKVEEAWSQDGRFLPGARRERPVGEGLSAPRLVRHLLVGPMPASGGIPNTLPGSVPSRRSAASAT